MEQKRVKIGKDVYQLTAVTADISGAISLDLIADFAPLVVCLMDGNIELFTKELRVTGNSEKIMRMLLELINVNILEKNNELVQDWKEEFARKPMTLFKLGWEALRFNCEDFFTFISGSVNEKIIGENLKDTIQSLKKDGVEIPPIFSLLFQNGEVETEVAQQSK